MWPLALSVLFLVAAIGVTYAGSRQGVGTLTCTVEPSPGRQQELGCRYQSHAGATARFRGHITRLGANKQIEANRVLVWSILGPPSLDSADLDGRFRSKPRWRARDNDPGQRLVGGLGDSIALIPPSGRQQIPGNAAITVLELNLSALKV